MAAWLPRPCTVISKLSPENPIARERLEQAFFHHDPAAALVLLGRLEYEVDRALEVARLGEIAGRAQQHGRMPVVAARVHHVGVDGTVRERVDLGDGERIHVGAQPDRGAVTVHEAADDAGPGQAAVDLDPELAKLGGDEVGGARLLEGDLGMRVQIPPPGGHLGVELGDVGNDGHDGGELRPLSDQIESISWLRTCLREDGLACPRRRGSKRDAGRRRKDALQTDR